MKQNLLLALLLSAYGFLAPFNGSNANNKFTRNNSTEQAPTKNIVRIFPNPSYNGTISVSSTITDKIHFYIFDLEGTLIHQSILKNKQKQTIENLKKGVYMYDVFKDDVSAEHGKLVIK